MLDFNLRITPAAIKTTKINIITVYTIIAVQQRIKSMKIIQKKSDQIADNPIGSFEFEISLIQAPILFLKKAKFNNELALSSASSLSRLSIFIYFSPSGPIIMLSGFFVGSLSSSFFDAGIQNLFRKFFDVK